MIWKKILYSLIAAVLVLFIINAQYFMVQLNYYLNEPEPIQVIVKEDKKVEPNMLWIETLGITAPIIYVTEPNEDKIQEGLQNGVVHYPNTALPGEHGNVYVMGHSSDFITAKGNYKTVFALLPKIEIGNIISISNKQGKLYKYKVDQKFVVSPSDTSVLNQDMAKKQLTLQTSYPVGTALKRYIVTAYLMEE